MTKDMTQGCTWKLILFFSIPLFLGNLFQQIYSMADTIIVGRFVGLQALAAVGATASINFLVLGFAMGLTGGFSVVIAQRFGAGDEEGVKRAVAQTIIVCVVSAAILTAISVAGSRWMLTMMDTPADIFEEAWIYITIIFGGLGATIYYNMIAGVLRALGDSKTPLYFLIFSSVINIILDIVLITVFHMGVAGASVATVASQLLSAILCTFYAAKRYEILRLSAKDFKKNIPMVKGLLRVGIPMALQFSVTAVGTMILQWALNSFGSVHIAAFTVANKVEQLVTQAFVALGTTMATYCGQNLGAGRMERIKKGMKECILICAVCVVISSLINVFGGQFFVELFMGQEDVSNRAAVLEYAQIYLNTVAIFYPFLGMIFVFRNALQGMGNALWPMIGGVGELLARFVVAITLPGVIGYLGVCLASPVAWVVAAVPLMLVYLGWSKAH